MCVMCCQAFKRKLQEGINPAITLTVLIMPNGFGVAVPVCLPHLEAPEGNLKAVETAKHLVNPFTGDPL